MGKIDLYDPKWVDMVFAGKNQAYGAYVLRKGTSSRNIKALLILICAAVLIGGFLGYLVWKNKHDAELLAEYNQKMELKALQEAQKEAEKQKDKPKPKPKIEPEKIVPEVKSTKVNTVPVIKEDDKVDESKMMQTMEKLVDDKRSSGVEEVKGTDNATAVAAAPSVATPAEVAPPPPPVKKEEPKPRPQKPQQSKPQQPRPTKPRREEKPAEAAAEAPAAPAVELPECHDDNAQRITVFLTGLLEHMESPAAVKVYEEEKGRYKAILEGQKLGALIGRRGETLDAIQQLTNYAVNSGSEKRIRVHVDAENYRARREASLESLAMKVAAKVKKYRRSVTLEAMNAYERHVIHAALQDVKGVTTYSVGTEPNRRVVVAYDRSENN